MKKPYYETIIENSQLGISLTFCTAPGGYHPLHWHEETEILFPLNGAADITIEGRTHKLSSKNITVVEACQIHSTCSYDKTSMFLAIHFSKKHLVDYLPGIISCYIDCISDSIDPEHTSEYTDICNLLAEITRLYILDVPSFRLEAEGIVLQVIARLTRSFSVDCIPNASSADLLTVQRIRKVITYVEQHFQETVSLQDMADLLGVSKEYFCRLFKKNMNLSFFQYVNEIRLSHAYDDLQSTDLPVSIIMEKNGFSNQRIFNQSFKKMYHCTPSSVRKSHNILS